MGETEEAKEPLRFVGAEFVRFSRGNESLRQAAFLMCALDGKRAPRSFQAFFSKVSFGAVRLIRSSLSVRV